MGKADDVVVDRDFLSRVGGVVRDCGGCLLVCSSARALGGFGIGISTIAAPLYIAEIAPAARRGRLTALFQFNIVFGILLAFLSNYVIGRTFDAGIAWRWMLGVEALPALFYTVLCFWLPESPRWLMTRRGGREGGLAVLRSIHPSASAHDVGAMANEILRAQEETKIQSGFWSRRLSVPLLLAFLVAFFNQLSGINAILYFAPRIFELAGLSERCAAAVDRDWCQQFDFHFCRALADRPGRSSRSPVYRFVRLFDFARAYGLGVLHGQLRDRAGVHFCVYRCACGRAGHGDLGADFRGVSQPAPRGWAGLGQFYALVFRSGSHDVFSKVGHGLSSRHGILVFLRDDVSPFAVGLADGSGNQGSFTRGDSTKDHQSVAFCF
ncbi:MAG: MFS transporter [Magnetospirillum sp.]|nr:MFS transporter [Magnetospirillum sp.]